MKNKINATKYMTVLLVSTGAACFSLEAKSPTTFFALQKAVMQGNAKEVSDILRVAPLLVHEREESGENILFDLDITEQNMDEIGKILIKTGADVNAQDETGMTPLHHAVTTKNLDLVRFLLKSGADPTIRDTQGHTPLSLLVHDDVDLRALFEKYGVEFSCSVRHV